MLTRPGSKRLPGTRRLRRRTRATRLRTRATRLRTRATRLRRRRPTHRRPGYSETSPAVVSRKQSFLCTSVLKSSTSNRKDNSTRNTNGNMASRPTAAGLEGGESGGEESVGPEGERGRSGTARGVTRRRRKLARLTPWPPSSIPICLTHRSEPAGEGLGE